MAPAIAPRFRARTGGFEPERGFRSTREGRDRRILGAFHDVLTQLKRK